MNAHKMFISFVPWLLFTMMIHRHGSNAAGVAALLAAGLALLFTAKGAQGGGVKLLDVTGVATFAGLAAACFAGGKHATDWVADYGRGGAALVLAAVMLASTLAVPFSEQYAREETPREHWRSPVFRAVNRKISTAWGVIVLVMACGHLLAGKVDPTTSPSAGSRPVDLVLNWVLPIVLVMAGVSYTKHAADAASTRPSTRSAGQPDARQRQP